MILVQVGLERFHFRIIRAEVFYILSSFVGNILVEQADLQDIGIKIIQQAAAEMGEKFLSGVDQHQLDGELVQARHQLFIFGGNMNQSVQLPAESSFFCLSCSTWRSIRETATPLL